MEATYLAPSVSLMRTGRPEALGTTYYVHPPTLPPVLVPQLAEALVLTGVAGL